MESNAITVGGGEELNFLNNSHSIVLRHRIHPKVSSLAKDLSFLYNPLLSNSLFNFSSAKPKFFSSILRVLTAISLGFALTRNDNALAFSVLKAKKNERTV